MVAAYVIGSVLVGSLACWLGRASRDGCSGFKGLAMSLASEQVLLRVYLQSADRAPHVPTYAQLIAAARREKLAGATALRGFMGAGYHGILKPTGVFSFVEHLPIIVEIVNTAEKIGAFVGGTMDSLMIGGMATLEREAVMMVRMARRAAPPELAELAAEMKPLSTIPKIQPGSHMNVNDNGILLRVFIGESDRWEHQPLYRSHLAEGARARPRRRDRAPRQRGIRRQQRRPQIPPAGDVFRLADRDRDREHRSENPKLQPHLETMVQEGMITMEYVMILMYRHNRG